MPKTTRTTTRTSTRSKTASGNALRQTSRKSGIDEFVDIVTSRPVADQKAAYKVLKNASRHGQD